VSVEGTVPAEWYLEVKAERDRLRSDFSLALSNGKRLETECVRLRDALRKIAEMDRQGYALWPVDVARAALADRDAPAALEEK
jgi:hypothetical protein